MGWASCYEDIQKRRDEALSQLTNAFVSNRLTEIELDRLKKEVEYIVTQAFKSLEEILDVITDPDFDAAHDVKEIGERNIRLSGELHRAKSEIERLQRELALSAETIKQLNRIKRDLEHDLHDEKQRRIATRRQGRGRARL